MAPSSLAPPPTDAAPTASVLLVDDHPANLLALEAVLDPLGARLVRASSGTEALEHLLRGDFAAIVLDVQMPGLDGFETAAMIRQRERTREVPILFVTAIHRDEAHQTRGYAQGAVDYLAKPFNPDVLRAKVAAFVALWQRGEILRQREAQVHAREQAAQAARVGENEGLFLGEFRTVSPGDGRVRWVEARACPTRGAGDGAGRLLGTVVDITARKQAEFERDRLLREVQDARAGAEAERTRACVQGGRRGR